MAIDAQSELEMYERMRAQLSHLLPDFEIRAKAEIAYEINRLKRERGAIILGHNYMEPALYYSVPDIVGDSLELSRRAAQTDRDPIVFCGVRFMAETAKILNPEKKVLLPAQVAGCSLAASITAKDVRQLKARFPGVPVITYINTYADVKAEVDICCTSSNAARIVQALDTDLVIFLPDEYLARNVADEVGRTIVLSTDSNETILANGQTPKMLAWSGRCEVHEQFTVQDIEQARKQFPDVVVVAHPECSPEVVRASDYAGSTTRMVKYVQDSPASRFLILTECSMGDNIIAENPTKDIIRTCSIRCPHMNEITLEDTLRALRTDEQEIHVPEDIRVRAKLSLDRMLAMS